MSLLGLLSAILPFASSIGGPVVTNLMQARHNKSMYNMQRQDFLSDRQHAEDYNSPSAQVQRLKDAGLNPTLAMSNIQTGQVNNPNSPNAQSAQLASIGQGLTEGVLGMLGLKSDLKLKDAQARDVAADAKLKEIQAVTAARENLARIGKLEGEGRESWRRGDHIDSLSTAQYQKFMADIGESASRAELNWALHATQMYQLKNLPIQTSLNWIEQVGRIMEGYTRQEVNRRQAEKLIEEATAARFGWKGQKFENELNEETKRYLIRQRKFDSSPKSFQHGLAAGALEFGDGVNSIFDLW